MRLLKPRAPVAFKLHWKKAGSLYKPRPLPGVPTAYEDWADITPAPVDFVEFNHSTSLLLVAIVYACKIALQLGILKTRRGSWWGYGTFTKTMRPKRVQNDGGEGIDVAGWGLGVKDGHAVLLQLILFVFRGEGSAFRKYLHCDALASRIDAGTADKQLCERLASEATDTSLLRRLLVKMVDFGPVLARAFVKYDLCIPIVWCLPVTSSARTGLFSVVASMGEKFVLEGHGEGSENYLFDVVLEILNEIPGSKECMMSACMAGWDLIGHQRNTVARIVAATIQVTCPDHAVFSAASHEPISMATWKQITKHRQKRDG